MGDLIAWATKRGAALAGPPSPRQTSQIEVKWSAHAPGDSRAGLAPPDSFMKLGILIEGQMTTDFVSVESEQTRVTQSRRGDYVIWHGPSYSHQWKTDTGATVVTIRWPARD